MAMGEALNRFGDWYGSPVNVASRVTAVAKASSVLATEAVRNAAGDRFAWSNAGKRRLRGIREDVAHTGAAASRARASAAGESASATRGPGRILAVMCSKRPPRRRG